MARCDLCHREGISGFENAHIGDFVTVCKARKACDERRRTIAQIRPQELLRGRRILAADTFYENGHEVLGIELDGGLRLWARNGSDYDPDVHWNVEVRSPF